MRALQTSLPGVLLLLAMACPGFNEPLLQPLASNTAHGPMSQTWTHDGREFSITVWPPDPAAPEAGRVPQLGISAGVEAIERWSAILSPEPGSEVSAMNRALAEDPSHRATLSQGLAEFVHFSLTGARATNGGFDPTGRDWERTRLDGLTLTAPGGRFDTLLLADAWIADRAVDAIRDAGIKAAVVAVRRSWVVAVLGAPAPGGPPSRIPLGIPLANLSDRAVIGAEHAAPAGAVVAHNAASACVFYHALRGLAPDEAFELLERRKIAGWRQDPSWKEPRTTSGWATLAGE